METRRERKVVTVLFVDLVGFTARSEEMDPEDVEVELTRYHAQVRDELERFGGTVEKFIGDAVMAVFGAPISHEDDAERAVRAALSVRDWALSDVGLDVRIGINTGEALVRLDARPEAGEGIAVGDVVNTTSRLQSAAPTNGIIVGAATYRATRAAIDYEPAEAVIAKGKAQPVPAWIATGARSRFGVDVVDRPRTTFVGREHELGLLRSSLARARAETEPQLVTLVGVPGIGKSRLLHELSRLVDMDPELVVWRQGRCLPYGDGVSMWALSEIVKADAGILENDGPDVAEEKLAKTLDARDSDVDVEWMLSRLRPLVGMATPDVAPARREEQVAAWRQFVEGLADTGPAVVVFEDLHWADETMLEFIDEVAELASRVALLLVCTARPELLAKRPSWGAGRTNALTLSLRPLADDQTALLVDAVLSDVDGRAELRQAILERAEGNPLYAEEFARLVAETPGAEIRVPDNVQGIIAARLDTLEPDHKRLLQLAAVVGKVFWASAVGALAGTTDTDVDEGLRALERRELVRRERRSSLAGDTEFAFRHVVARDVAYGQIPRNERGVLHQQVAAWLGGLGRPDDHAELIAHHYLAAIDYAQLAGSDVDGISEPARRALRDAGDRAAALGNHSAASDFFAKALPLTPDGADRAELLAAYGTAHWLATGLVPQELAEAVDLFESLGLPEPAVDAAVALARAEGLHGTQEAAERWLATADRLSSATPSAPARYRTILARAGSLLVAGRPDRALELAAPQLDGIEQFGDPLLLARALDIVGCSRSSLGDEAGVELQLRAIEVARSARAIWELQVALNNLTAAFIGLGRLREVAAVLDTRRETFELFGGSTNTRSWFLLSMSADCYFRGDWDEAVRSASTLIDRLPAGITTLVESLALANRARVLVARDPHFDPRPDLRRAIEVARLTNDPKTLHDTLVNAAGLLADVGAHGDAQPLWGEALDRAEDGVPWAADDESVHFAWTATSLGEEEAAAAAIARMTPCIWTEVASVILRHDYARSAAQLDEIGHLPGVAHARLHLGAADVALALDFYRAVGAQRYIAMAEAALGGAH